MGSQSKAKTIFLLVSMVGWLLVGATLMYLFPLITDWLVASELTHTWMENLSHSGYHPLQVGLGGGTILMATVLGNLVWYRQYEQKDG